MFGGPTKHPAAGYMGLCAFLGVRSSSRFLGVGGLGAKKEKQKNCRQLRQKIATRRGHDCHVTRTSSSAYPVAQQLQKDLKEAIAKN